jgi:hypothetical protein
LGSHRAARRAAAPDSVSLSDTPDNGRCAAPSFGNDGGVEYMFYEPDERLAGAIAMARAV